MGQYKNAITYHQEAIEIAQEFNILDMEGSALMNLGLVYDSIGKSQESLEKYFLPASEIFQKLDTPRGIANGYTNLGVAYGHIGEYEKSLQYHQEALLLYRDIYDIHGEAKNLAEIGAIYYRIGDYQDALDNYKQGLAKYTEIHDLRGIGNVLMNMGIVYTQVAPLALTMQSLENLQDEGIPDQIIEQLRLLKNQSFTDEEALLKAIETQIGTERTITYTSLILKYAQSNYTMAIEIYQKALAIHQEIKNQAWEATTLSHLGAIHGSIGNYAKALELFDEALQLQRTIGDTYGIGWTLNYIGQMYLNLKQYQQAYDTFQQSLKTFGEIDSKEGLWLAQRSLAFVEVQFDQLESALQYYEQSINTIEELRGGLTEEENKFSFIKNKLFVYDELIELLQKLDRQYPDKDYDRKALEYFERKQGRIFLEQMGKSGARQFSGIPEDIVLKEEKLNQQIGAIHTKFLETLAAGGDTSELQQNEERLKIAYLKVQETIQTEYPEYAALMYPVPVVLSDLQQDILQDNELLLIYGVMEKQTLLWVVSKQGFKLVPLDISEEELSTKIQAFRAMIDAIIAVPGKAYNTLDHIIQQGYEFYQLLIPDDEDIYRLMKQAKRLSIIPTGPLYSLPFEAFVTEKPEPGEKPSYLLAKYPMTYLSSASLVKIIREAQNRKKEDAAYPLLAFAHPVYNQTQTNIGSSSDDSVGELRTRSYHEFMGEFFGSLVIPGIKHNFISSFMQNVHTPQDRDEFVDTSD